jgi:hypothetical protein
LADDLNSNIVSVFVRLIRFLFHLLAWIIRIALMLFLLQYSVLPFGDQWTAVGILARHEQFDYIGWEVGALGAKVDQTLFGVHPFMDEATRSAYVRAYFADLERARGLEGRIDAIYVDPDVDDPELESAELRAERNALRENLAGRQSMAEAILEGQVAAVLVDEGFGVAGQLLPAISMRFTQVPNLLIVSPRDEIRFEVSINLNPMPIDEIAALEDQIDREQDVSSLIVPLGGIALYPAMILETTSLSFAVETFAHEWLHHYLFFFPLGLSYDFANEARVINETTARLFGEVVAPLVLRRYYPELAPPEQASSRQPSSLTLASFTHQDTPPFDFGAAMHETRIRVDELLAEGRVEEAEAYMEERRRLFIENGYGIRKLNQAYFAFFGGYQSGAPGAGGQDPTGAAVRVLYEQSESIHAWIVTMRGITTREQLLDASQTPSL